MKKIIISILSLILIFTMCFSLVACGDEDIDALKQTIEDLKAQIADLQNSSGSSDIEDLESKIEDLEKDIASLETRVKKLETSASLISTLEKRISALENSGIDAQEYAKLKAQVETLQTALTDNSASDSEVKSQVTEMQLVLNKIYGSDGSDGVLEEIQSSLNTLYGEVDRVQQFENGKEYEVKLNGVVYYTVSVIVEYHDGVVQSEQDIITCTNKNRPHWCAGITVTNKMFDTITSVDFGNMMRYIFDDIKINPSYFHSKNHIQLSQEDRTLANNETKRWYFEIDGGEYSIKNNVKLSFSLNVNPSVRILILDNVWDGVQEPIQGVKS